MSWLVSNSEANGTDRLVQGTYQSPILIQWQKAPQRQRSLDITITRFQ
jgi:hypothetical protein